MGQGFHNHEVYRSHKTTHQSVGLLWTFSPSHWPLPVQHTTLTTDIHAPPVGFKHTISTGERPQTYALDRSATGTCYVGLSVRIIKPTNAHNKCNTIVCINCRNLSRSYCTIHRELGRGGVRRNATVFYPDVWLTVHRNSVWIRKTNWMSLFVFFISVLIVAQHVSGNHVPIISSWRLRDVIASCWYVPWLQGGCQVRLAGSASMDGLCTGLSRDRVLVASRDHFSGRYPVIQGFPNFRFPKIFADKMERCCCTDTKCKCYIRCNGSPEIFGRGDVMHNHDADREAFLNRQILNNSVKRKAMEDLCERPCKLIHKELHSQ